MKRYAIPLVVVLAVLIVAQMGFGQIDRGGRRDRPPVQPRKRYQDMTEAEKEEFRATLEERRKQFQNMSEAEKAKLRAEMRQRFGAEALSYGREQQLAAITVIEEQLAKLRATIESVDPNDLRGLRDLPEDERAELRKKMGAAMRDRQTALGAIEDEIGKLRLAGRPATGPGPGVNELRALHDLAVKEQATETAKQIENLIARYSRLAPGRDRPGGPRPPRERPPGPPRPRPGEADAGGTVRPFALQTFDGKTVNLADYRDKTVVLEWFNAECPFVQYHYDTANTMIKLAKKYKDQGVVWLAINSTSHTTRAANTAFVAKHNLPYPLLDDRSGKVGRAYGARTTPHVFIITPSGSIAYDGAIDNSPLGKTLAGQEPVNYVDRALTELLAGKDVSTPKTRSYGCSVKYAQ